VNVTLHLLCEDIVMLSLLCPFVVLGLMGFLTGKNETVKSLLISFLFFSFSLKLWISLTRLTCCMAPSLSSARPQNVLLCQLVQSINLFLFYLNFIFIFIFFINDFSSSS
jgi:hypothetical protein